MDMFLWVIVGADQLLLVIVYSIQLSFYESSDFLIREQFSGKNDQYSRVRRKLHKLLPEVMVLQKMVLAVMAIIQISLLTYLLGIALGIVTSILLGVCTLLACRLAGLQRSASRLFERYLPIILSVTKKLHPVWVVIGVPVRSQVYLPASLDEFTDQLRRLPSTVLDPQQRQRLESVLEAEGKTVHDIMTPKKRVIMVEPNAVLGPILLSDLLKSGHGHFPVVTKSGELQGVISLSDISDIHDAKKRTTVHDSMNEQVAWVESETSLFELVQAFLQEKTYLIVVRDADGEFCGVVTIADLVKHVLGITKDITT